MSDILVPKRTFGVRHSESSFFMPKLTQEEYDLIHGELGTKYNTDPRIIRFIRSTVHQELFNKKELEDFVLKTLLNKKAEKTLTRYNAYARFLSTIDEADYQYILMYKKD